MFEIKANWDLGDSYNESSVLNIVKETFKNIFFVPLVWIVLDNEEPELRICIASFTQAFGQNESTLQGLAISQLMFL